MADTQHGPFAVIETVRVLTMPSTATITATSTWM